MNRTRCSFHSFSIYLLRLARFVVFFAMANLVIAQDATDMAEESVFKHNTLRQAIEEAQKNDPWLQGSVYKQESLIALSVSASTLPDPTVNIGIANLPTDSFDFGQEDMTQFNVGIAQMFPRGNTRALTQKKLEQLSSVQPFARADRKAMVAVTVANLWLEVYRNEKAIVLIERNRSLFEDLVDIVESSYATASGKTRQQDFIRAQLELTRLEDKLTQLHQRRDEYSARLSEWINAAVLPRSFIAEDIELNVSVSKSVLGNVQATRITEYLIRHPKIRMIEQAMDAGDTDVDIAQQQYKPQWGVSAGYGYRDRDSVGRERSDFFSVALRVDAPLFTSKRQDKQVQSAHAQREAIKTERVLALRQLKSDFDTALSTYKRLQERQALYNNRLLTQISEQAEASLAAYTHDNGRFSDVIRARIDELEAQIEALYINVDIQKSIAQLHYFLVGQPLGALE